MIGDKSKLFPFSPSLLPQKRFYILILMERLVVVVLEGCHCFLGLQCKEPLGEQLPDPKIGIIFHLLRNPRTSCLINLICVSCSGTLPRSSSFGLGMWPTSSTVKTGIRNACSFSGIFPSCSYCVLWHFPFPS